MAGRIRWIVGCVLGALVLATFFFGRDGARTVGVGRHDGASGPQGDVRGTTEPSLVAEASARAAISHSTEDGADGGAGAKLDEAVGAIRRDIRVRVESLDGAALGAVPVRLTRGSDVRGLVRETGADGWVTFEPHEVTEWPVRNSVALAIGAGDRAGWRETGASLRAGERHVFRIDGLAHVDITVLGAQDGHWVGLGWRGSLLRASRADPRERLGAGGTARFPVLSSSGRMTAYAARIGDSFAATETFVAPAAGETAHVVLVAQVPAIEIAGRAVSSTGAPVASGEFVARIALRERALVDARSEPKAWMMTRAPVGTDGKFSIALDDSWMGHHVVLFVGRPGFEGESARLELAPLALGRVDVGDVQLARADILAAGWVVDAHGEGVAGAQLSLMTDLVDLATAEIWLTETSADGAFELRGPRPPLGRVRLLARAAGYFDRHVDLAREPSFEHRIVLDGAARLLGAVVTHEGVPAAGVGVRVVSRSPSGESLPGGYGADVESDGSFALGPLRPGPATFTVWHVGGGEIRSVDLELVPGDMRDPRLDPLRLPPEYGTFEVTFLDSDGREPHGLVVGSSARKADGEPAAISLFFGHGVARRRFTGRAGEIDVAAAAPGHRVAVARAVSGDVVVTLERAPRLELVLDPDTPRAPDGLVWSVQPLFTDGRVHVTAFPVEFRSGRATIDAHSGGELHLHFGLRDVKTNAMFGQRGGAEGPAVFQIDASPPARLVVRPSGAWIQRAFDSVRER